MSPNVAFGIVVGVVIALCTVGGVGIGMGQLGNRRAGCIGVGAAVLAIALILAGTDLSDYATGKARYEQRNNPDGTRTWQRVEVTK